MRPLPRTLFPTGLLAAVLIAAGSAAAQPADAAVRLAAQRDAMKPLAWMDGTWRGPAWVAMPDGTRRNLTQTERIGPFLGGSVRVVEGRGYDSDGTLGFNAFATIAFDPASKRYTFHSHALGHSGNFPFTPTADGFVWQVPAGPGAVVKYTATFKDGTWREVGEYQRGGEPGRQVFEMNLKRLGDTGWPAEGAVPMR